jgi:hypothetical protein
VSLWERGARSYAKWSARKQPQMSVSDVDEARAC